MLYLDGSFKKTPQMLIHCWKHEKEKNMDLLHYLILYDTGVNGRSKLLGLCEFHKTEEMAKKIEFLCKAHGWKLSSIVWLPLNDNTLLESYKAL